jgi:enamine deaminase RidA (YjgF/YER057c/UK114 family)
MAQTRRSLLAVLLIAVAISGTAQHATRQHKAAEGKSAAAAPFRLLNPDTMPKPVATYSQLAEVNDGKIVFVSGQVAVDKSGNLVGKDDFRAQVQAVFENLKGAAEGGGGDFHNLVKLNFYVAESVDPSQYAAFREVRDKYIDTAHPPVSTFVVVKRLARPEYMLEVEAVAVVSRGK